MNILSKPNINKLIKEPQKLLKIPSKIFDRIIQKISIEINYRLFLKSGEKAVNGDISYNLDNVGNAFSEIGFPPKKYNIDIDAYGSYFPEKALEHFVSLSFSEKLNETSKIIDIANAGSPFPDIAHKIFGCHVYSNDLKFKKGVHKLSAWHIRLGCDAYKLPVKENTFDLVVLHCAFEIFEDEKDIGLIKKACRVLKKGGKLVILPLYMNELYHIFRDPRTSRINLPAIDRGARLVYRNNFHGVAFARFYNVDAFYKRVITNMQGFKLSIYRVQNLYEICKNCYLNWIAVFEK